MGNPYDALGNSSLLDVFRGAVGVTNQGLDIYSQRKKEELDAIDYEKALQLKEEMGKVKDAFLQPDETGQNLYQQNPQAYQDLINKTITDWQQGAIKAGNQSKYYNDLVKRRAMGAQVEMNLWQNDARVNVERQNLAIARSKLKNAIANDKTLDPLQMLEAMLEIDRKPDNYYGPVQLYEAELQTYKHCLDRAGTWTDDRSDTETASKAVGDRMEEFIAKASEQLGINADEVLANKEGEITQAQQLAKAAVRDRNNIIFYTAANEFSWYKQEIQARLKSGEDVSGLRREAIALYNWGNAEKDGIRDGKRAREYHDDKRSEMMDEFAWFAELGIPQWSGGGGGGGSSGGGGGGGRSGREPPKSFIDNLARIRDQWLQATIRGEHSITNGERMYAEALMKELEGTGYTLADVEYYGEGKLNIFTFFQDAFNGLNKELKAAGLKGLDEEQQASLKAIFKSEEVSSYYNRLDAVQKNEMDMFMNRAWRDIVADAGRGNLDGVTEKTKRLCEGVVARQIFSTAEFKFDLKSERGANDFLEYLENYGDLLAFHDYLGTEPIGYDDNGNLITRRGNSVFAGGKERYEKMAEGLKLEFAYRCGIRPDNIQVVFRNELGPDGKPLKGDPHEITAQFQFVVTGAGAQNGIYRPKANTDKNKDFIIERLDDKGNGTPVPIPGRKEKREQENRDQRRDTREKSNEAAIDEICTYFEKGIELGANIPAAKQMIDNGQATEYSFYSRGYNRRTGKKMTQQEMVDLYNKSDANTQRSLVTSWDKIGILPDALKKRRESGNYIPPGTIPGR